MPEPASPADRLTALIERSGLAPRVALVLGSGLGALAHAADVCQRATLDDLLGLHAPSVAGHAREVLVGTLAGHAAVIFLGRYHLYQGLTAAQVAAPVRELEGTPVETLVLTNAAGGLNPAYQVGDLMLIADHLNLPGLAGQSPLIPPRGDEVGFVPMRDAYSPRLRMLARDAGRRIGLEVREGVYAMVAGPSYETAAELGMLRALGADAVGMSTVPETILARHCGLRVAAVSVIANLAEGLGPTGPSHEETLAATRRAAGDLARLVEDFCKSLAAQ